MPVTWSRLMHWARLALFGLMLATLAPSALADEEPITSGRLRPFGHYLHKPSGHTATVLPDGSVLVYGHGPSTHSGDNLAAQTLKLRERIEHAIPSGPDTAPKLWDRARRGWRRLPTAPECDSPARSMHTATLLPNGKVLMAGGLCDQPKMADDLSPHRAYAALSIWDSATRQWQAAPSLAEARLFHTANLLPDGSVVIAGGEVDPGLSSTPHALVLGSAERFSENRVTPMPAMATGRAKHTATLLADGSLLVVGGFDANGQAIASAERWNPTTKTWQTLPPASVARYSHTATLLPDGRVMVCGGIGTDGQILPSVELFDPKTQTWSDAAPLPIPLYGHAATLLASGKVLTAGGTWLSNLGPMPWAWTWNPTSNTWQVGGHIASSGSPDLGSISTQITLAPRPDGSALVLTPEHIMRWEPTVEDPLRAAPIWHEQPSAARLADGRILWVGLPETETGAQARIARLWDPVARTWADAGTLNQRTWMNASTHQLPSGRVIHVGINGDSTLVCESWEGGSKPWQPCGNIHVAHEVRGRIQLSTLPDGRALAIANHEDVFVLDEARPWWTPWQAQWHTEGLTYGAPIRAQQALLTITDPATGQSHTLNEDAARQWQNDSSGTASSLLWDGKSKQWAYVFRDRQMGTNAQWLPDGCALSTAPLAVFNPATGKVTRLADPGMGIDPHHAEMVVLGDGTVVAAGVPDGAKDPGAGVGFYQGRASCSGFEPRGIEDAYMAGGLADEMPAATAAAASSTQAASAPSPWRERLMNALPSRGQWLLIALGLLTLYGLSKAANSTRVVVIGLGLLIGLGTLWIRGRTPGTVSATPCKMVGVWSSRQGQAMRRIELKDDGSYAMEPSQLGNDRSGGYTGRWAVQGDKMIWHHDQGVAYGLGDETNPILRDSDTRFTLIEGNGSRTVYELIRAVPSQHCTP